MKKIFKKVVLYTFVALLLLFSCLQVPIVQKYIVNKTISVLHNEHNIDIEINKIGGVWPFTLKAEAIEINTNEINCNLISVYMSLDIWSTFSFRPKIKLIHIKKSIFTQKDAKHVVENQETNPENIIKSILMLIKQTYVQQAAIEHIEMRGFESCIFSCDYKPLSDGSHFSLTPVGYSSLIDAQIHHKNDLTTAIFSYDTKNIPCVNHMFDTVFKNVPENIKQYAEKLKKLSLVLKVKDFNLQSLTADFKTKASFIDGDVDAVGAIQNGTSYSFDVQNTMQFTLPLFGKLENLSSIGCITKQNIFNIQKLSINGDLLSVSLSGKAKGTVTDNLMSMLGTLNHAEATINLSGAAVKTYLGLANCEMDIKTDRNQKTIEAEIALSKAVCTNNILKQILNPNDPIKITYDEGMKVIVSLNHHNALILQTNADFSSNMLILQSRQKNSLFEDSAVAVNLHKNTLSIKGEIKPRGNNVIKIDILTDPQLKEFNGNLAVNIKDMAPFTTLVNFATVGHLDGSIQCINYSPQLKKGKVTVDLLSKYFRSPRSKTELVTIKGHLNGNGDLDIVKKIQQLAIGKLFLAQTASASLKGNMFNNMIFALNADSHKIGYLSSPIKIDIQGGFNATKNDVNINVFHIEHLKQKLHLKEPVHINLSPLKVQNGTLQSTTGEIRFQNIECHKKFGLQKWTGLITAANLPVGIINWFLHKTLLVGKINGEISLSGTKQTPDIKTTLAVKGLQWGQLNVFTPGAEETLDCDLYVHKKEDHIEWNTKLSGKKLADFIAEGNFYVSPFKENPIKASMKGYLDLSLISAIAATGDRLSGKIDCQLSLSGTVLNPILNGDIRTENAYVELAEFGTVINKINAHLKAKGTRITIQSLTATDEPLILREKNWNIGRLTMSGYIDFANLLEPHVQMDFIVRNFLLVNSDSIVGVGGGDLKIQGEGIYAKIMGHADIEKIAINLNELDTDDDIPMIPLKDPKKRQYAKTYQKDQDLENERTILPLDITLKTHGKLTIHGNIISHSIWGGDMNVLGPINAPSLDGKLALKSGVLDFFGTSLKIESASVTFAKEKRNDVWLLMTAGKTVSDIELKMLIDTNQDTPVSFKSSPSYAQDEVLSLMLFGKVAGSVSPGQSIQLAAALARLKGKKGLNIMDDIRKGFGFDTFELTEQTDSNNIVSDNSATNYAVRIGKKITDNTEILAEQGTGNSTSKLIIETAITDNLSFEAALAAQRKNDGNEYDKSSSGSSAGLVWSKRY
jgi:hypothetical protein